MAVSNPDKDAIIAAERRWVEVYRRNDDKTFATMLTDGFVYTSPVGEFVPRKTYLDNLRDRIVVMTTVEPSDEEVHLYGDSAIVTAQWTVDESYRGHPFKGAVRITRVWVREKSEWKAAAFQVTTTVQH